MLDRKRSNHGRNERLTRPGDLVIPTPKVRNSELSPSACFGRRFMSRGPGSCGTTAQSLPVVLSFALAVGRHSSADNSRFRMKLLIAIVAMVFFTSGAVHADGHASRLEIKNAQILAQNNSGREACRLGCNGNGACLQACDVTTCRQACGGDGTCLQSCAPSNCRLGCNGDGACLRGCAERDRGLGNR
jgi:hypothetical protein